MTALGLAAGASGPASSGGYEPSADDLALLGRLRPAHPRVILTPGAIEELRALVRSDAEARAMLSDLKARAARILGEPPVKYELKGPRLLEQSRRCVERTSTLALLHVLEGERKWLERALLELRSAAAFKDWNPSHFLDTAEMLFAFAVGYDWLHGSLSDEERELLRGAMVSKGLLPTAEAHAKGAWWTKCNHNWNQVCNGGAVAGALALAEVERPLAAYVLGRSLRSLPLAMASFAPDGGWAEGPGYWSYATQYNVYLLASLDSALGTDLGLSNLAGFEETPLFRIASEGPTGLFFNYADCGERAGRAAQMWYFARKFAEPAWSEWARERPGGSAFDLIWFVPRGAVLGRGTQTSRGAKSAAPLPLDSVFRGIDVAFLRGAWRDQSASYAGFKGGDNAANHSHLDLGTFVFDSLGVRWAVDLAGDDYNLPGYFGKERWGYYRLRTEGHNTLVISGENQEPKAKAPIVAFCSSHSTRQGPSASSPGAADLFGLRDAAFAVADLSAAYAKKARSVRRGVALLDRRDLLVLDEVEANEPVEVIWQMHTKAKAELDPPGARGGALLEQDGKALLARLLLPKEGARFELLPAEGRGTPNKGVQKLAVRLAAPCAIAVLLSPVPAAPAPAHLEPLAAWIAKGRLEPPGKSR